MVSTGYLREWAEQRATSSRPSWLWSDQNSSAKRNSLRTRSETVERKTAAVPLYQQWCSRRHIGESVLTVMSQLVILNGARSHRLTFADKNSTTISFSLLNMRSSHKPICKCLVVTVLKLFSQNINTMNWGRDALPRLKSTRRSFTIG